MGSDRPEAERFILAPEDREAIEHEMSHYDDPRAASIEALKIVQKRHGWVPDGAIAEIGKVLGISAVDVEGVATFYNLIYRQPVGRHVIKICDSVGCYLTGYETVCEAISRKLGIGLGETTPDGRFTLLPICCLGACDKGPVLMIDDDTHGNLTVEGIDQLLEQYA
ncbi:NADH-quinone oxidoreductase subunit NuoE [Mangrovitalea sediminis]|uniref:NADH-quinone oxidoreductase subunit NuoE n=1 Tax=Mangrovitalea sediminis TaxID=1982043 RepID=UPI003872E98A